MDKPKSAARHQNLRPLADRVLVRKLPEDRSKGGIILPAVHGREYVRAEILAVGPGKHEHGVLVRIELEIGEIVVFPLVMAQMVRFPGEDELLLIPAGEIVGVLEGQDAKGLAAAR